ncbi:MAG: hypothetical protein ACWGO1_10005 [Anaerolineales bacterium]
MDFLFSQIAADESGLGYLLRYIRYAGVSLWVTFGAPWVFIKFRLAEPAVQAAVPTQVAHSSIS